MGRGRQGEEEEGEGGTDGEEVSRLLQLQQCDVQGGGEARLHGLLVLLAGDAGWGCWDSSNCHTGPCIEGVAGRRRPWGRLDCRSGPC